MAIIDMATTSNFIINHFTENCSIAKSYSAKSCFNSITRNYFNVRSFMVNNLTTNNSKASKDLCCVSMTGSC